MNIPSPAGTQPAPAGRTPLTPGMLSVDEQIRAAREIVRREAVAIYDLSNRLNESYIAIPVADGAGGLPYT